MQDMKCPSYQSRCIHVANQTICFCPQDIINHIRSTSHSAAYASSMSPPVTQQIISSMKIIMGEDGTDEGMSVITASKSASICFLTTKFLII